MALLGGAPGRVSMPEADSIYDQASRRSLEAITAAYQPTHDHIKVDARRYPHLDRGFYEAVTAELERRGFLQHPDVEDRSLRRLPANLLMPTFMRPMLSGDGIVMATFHHARVRPALLRLLLALLGKASLRSIEFATEFSDGSFLTTGNAIDALQMPLPPLVATEVLPRRTSAATLLDRHLARVWRHRDVRPGVHPRPVRTFEEMITSQDRRNALQAAWRGELGGMARAEIERLSLMPGKVDAENGGIWPGAAGWLRA